MDHPTSSSAVEKPQSPLSEVRKSTFLLQSAENPSDKANYTSPTKTSPYQELHAFLSHLRGASAKQVRVTITHYVIAAVIENESTRSDQSELSTGISELIFDHHLEKPPPLFFVIFVFY